MMRNEILEKGQTIILYNNGHWRGHSIGFGTLVQCEYRHSYEEQWGVVLEDGEETTWTMQRTDKEFPTPQPVPHLYEPTYLDEEDSLLGG